MRTAAKVLLFEDKSKKTNQVVTLKMVLPVGEAKNNAVLGPLLGQHQINIMSFCNEFNSKSLVLYETGVNVSVFVLLKKDKTYSLHISNPSLGFFLGQIVSQTGNDIVFKLEELYDVIKIISFFLGQEEKSVFRMVFGYLSSYNNRKNIKIV